MGRLSPQLEYPHVLSASVALLLGAACSGPSAQRVPDRPDGVEVADDAAPAVAPPAEGWASTLSVDHPLVGRIWSVSDAAFVDRARVVARVGEARFVLLGETHDNADHHRLQAEMVRAVVAAGRKPSVVFEMIERGMQDKVDEQLAHAPGAVDEFGEAIAWDESGWPAWAIYRPVFAATLDNGLPVIAAQLPRKEAMGLAQGGALPEELVRAYKLDAPLPGPLNKALEDELVASHCGHMPAAMMQPMMVVQRARDAIMADKLLHHATADGAILIAGGGHVRADRGVPWYMARPEDEVVTIGFLQVQDEADEPADYAAHYDGALPFDYVWFTPRDNDIDRCKELEERMKKMKQGHGETAGR